MEWNKNGREHLRRFLRGDFFVKPDGGLDNMGNITNLSAAFRWATSPDGEGYWYMVSRRIRQERGVEPMTELTQEVKDKLLMYLLME